MSDSVHLHSNGRDTKAHLEIGFKFMPKGYKPTYKRALHRPRQRRRHRHQGDGSRTSSCTPTPCCSENTKIMSFEPHLHAPGTRMCLEAIWGYNIQTLNCVGYDHNWVRGYDYDDDSAPLLPKGTILHIIGYMDNSPTNKNVPDPRNWQGSGNRSVANMFIDLGNRVALTDEQFQAEMAKRAPTNPGKDVISSAARCAGRAASRRRRPTQNQSSNSSTLRRRTHRGVRHQDRCGNDVIVPMCGSRSARSRSSLLTLLAVARRHDAQSLTYSSGQNVAPAYEGWEQDADGTKYFLFGYMNRNWEEELDVPVGPDNSFNAGRRRSGTADALPAAPQPLRLPRARAGRLHREGRARSGR